MTGGAGGAGGACGVCGACGARGVRGAVGASGASGASWLIDWGGVVGLEVGAVGAGGRLEMAKANVAGGG